MNTQLQNEVGALSRIKWNIANDLSDSSALFDGYLTTYELNGNVVCYIDLYQYLRDTTPALDAQPWNVDGWESMKVLFSAPASKPGFLVCKKAARAFFRSGIIPASTGAMTVSVLSHYLAQVH